MTLTYECGRKWYLIMRPFNEEDRGFLVTVLNSYLGSTLPVDRSMLWKIPKSLHQTWDLSIWKLPLTYTLPKYFFSVFLVNVDVHLNLLRALMTRSRAGEKGEEERGPNLLINWQSQGRRGGRKRIRVPLLTNKFGSEPTHPPTSEYRIMIMFWYVLLFLLLLLSF